ncbi:MAG: Mu transposase domain-containing protein [Thermomicrobiales bacterium]
MLTRREDVDVRALRERGWSISAIARHIGRDRGTVRNYLEGRREPGQRMSSVPDPLGPFEAYIRARFADDHTIWASALFDEVVKLGYDRSYVTFARQLRLRKLRPHCEACSGVRGRETIEIDHPPGAEIQWDWFERRRAPWGGTAYVLLGTLAHSARVRGVLAPSMGQPHLIEAMDGVLRRLGGTARAWRVDRLATVIVPGSRDVQPTFAPVAKFYGVTVDPCPPRRGNRKGSVESSVRYISGRWWKTMTDRTPEEAQRSLDRFCATTAEARVRPVPPSALERIRQQMARGEISRPLGPGVTGEGRLWRPTVRELADAEPLLALPPAPFPAVVETTVPVADNATVAFRGNRYSTPPGLAGIELTLRHRLGTGTLEVHSPAGVLLVSHRLAPAGAGAVVRTPEHRAALERAVLSSFTMAPPCDHKRNSPPGPAALAEAAKLLGPEGADVVIDLAAYQAITEGGRP